MKKLDENIEGLRGELTDFRNEFSDFKNDMLTGHDKIMKKLKENSVEMKMMNAQYRRHDTALDDHEIRIRRLETTAA